MFYHLSFIAQLFSGDHFYERTDSPDSNDAETFDFVTEK